MINRTEWNAAGAATIGHSGIEKLQISPYLPGVTNDPEYSRLEGIASLVMTGTLAGFLLVSYIPGALGVDSRVATVPFRALMRSGRSQNR
jgi:hypothetical protein